jgi:hypothetical protein
MQGASTTTTSFRANTQDTSIKAVARIYQGFIEVRVMQGASTTTTEVLVMQGAGCLRSLVMQDNN